MIRIATTTAAISYWGTFPKAAALSAETTVGIGFEWRIRSCRGFVCSRQICIIRYKNRTSKRCVLSFRTGPTGAGVLVATFYGFFRDFFFVVGCFFEMGPASNRVIWFKYLASPS
jgi:hypothetical protein